MNYFNKIIIFQIFLINIIGCNMSSNTMPLKNTIKSDITETERLLFIKNNKIMTIKPDGSDEKILKK